MILQLSSNYRYNSSTGVALFWSYVRSGCRGLLYSPEKVCVGLLLNGKFKTMPSLLEDSEKRDAHNRFSSFLWTVQPLWRCYDGPTHCPSPAVPETKGLSWRGIKANTAGRRPVSRGTHARSVETKGGLLTIKECDYGRFVMQKQRN